MCWVRMTARRPNPNQLKREVQLRRCLKIRQNIMLREYHTKLQTRTTITRIFPLQYPTVIDLYSGDQITLTRFPSVPCPIVKWARIPGRSKTCAESKE